MRRPARSALPLLLLPLLPACLLPGPRDRDPVEGMGPPDPFPPGHVRNWPLPPLEAAAAMAGSPVERLDVLYRKPAGSGVTGAAKLRVRFSEPPVEVFLKWKELPRGTLDGSNNSPRKEIAAWAVQALFLDPEDYVVPPSVVRCPPAGLYREAFHAPRARETLPGVDSVCGVATLWIDNVRVPRRLFDPVRFREDPTYAYFLSNFNLLTYLILHRDGRDGNILVSEEESRRQVFAIDNGISFGGHPYNYFVTNWHVLRIPAVRRHSVERLRALRREDLDVLLVIEEFRLDEENDLDRVAPGPPLDPDGGVTYLDGILQLGLTREEIDGVWERIQELLEDVDEGEIATF